MPKLNEDQHRIAINLRDLDRADSALRALVAQLIKPAPIRIDPNDLDEVAVAFACRPLQAATVCDLVREHDRRVGDAPTRVYLFRKTWSKLPSHEALAVGTGVSLRLNPKLFPESVEHVKPSSRQAQAIDFGSE